MNEFDWNGLRVGDRVVVHEHRTGVAQRAERLGVVAFVTQDRRHNAVGLRIDDDPTEVRWPTRFEVELSSRDRSRASL